MESWQPPSPPHRFPDHRKVAVALEQAHTITLRAGVDQNVAEGNVPARESLVGVGWWRGDAVKLSGHCGGDAEHGVKRA